MGFWKRGRSRRKVPQPSESGAAPAAKSPVKRSQPMPLEVKLLAMEAPEADLTPQDFGELVGMSDTTVTIWRALYQEGGVSALCRRASSIAVRQQCSALDTRILEQRRAHPEHGVRRIRDDLRRQQKLSVSAEEVRTVVHEAGLGPATRHFGRESRGEAGLANVNLDGDPVMRREDLPRREALQESVDGVGPGIRLRVGDTTKKDGAGMVHDRRLWREYPARQGSTERSSWLECRISSTVRTLEGGVNALHN